ncbi:hypothetical protein GCM10027429_04730 [Marivirga atlantica]|uniref:Zinc-dependent peptidase n=1 Tax=Marivirga atlantica TaxID=1548457 RepID=A0A937AI88_9BACT|nr:zinc-dependent peptidase [Marivirga atlantica]MBL0764083.1 zinc-dependent peptidase [Marivirga atlantica]
MEIIGFLIVLVVWAFVQIIKSNGFSRFNTWNIPFFLSGQLKPAHLDSLNKYSDFYRRLKPKYKREFEKRVLLFMNSKTFIPRQMSHVTDEMKVLISSVAIQLTFGLQRIYLAHFNKILVYPSKYYSTINNQYHKGEVNPRFGIIVLSWDAFVSGMSKPTDGLSLGLHELAHALHLENRIKNEEYGFFNYEAWKVYVHESNKERITIELGTNTFFRNYAAVDEYEFFAVVIELFFEQSKALYDYNKALYEALTILLQQNPLTILRS